MKPEIVLKALDEQYVRKEEEYYQDKNYILRANRRDVVAQDLYNDILYTFVYKYGNYDTPEVVIVANMEEKTWHTYNVEKGTWGKACLEKVTEYRPQYAKCIDEMLYGFSLMDMQRSVRNEKLKEKHEKKRNEIHAVMSLEKPITKKQREWMHRNVQHYALYVRGQQGATCTCCGEQLEGKFVNNEKYKCNKCKVKLIARTENTIPAQTARTFFIPQKIKDGIMIRIMNNIIVFKSGVSLGNYTYTGEPGTYLEENLRCVVRNGKQTWYERRVWKSDEWKENRKEGWIKNRNSPHVYEKPIYDCWNKEIKNKPLTETNALKKVVAKTALRYISFDTLQEFLQVQGNKREAIYDWIDLLVAIENYPQIESLIKLGYRELAGNIMLKKERARKELHGEQKELHKFLGISKELWRELENHKELDLDDLEVMRFIEKNTRDMELVFRLRKRMTKSDTEILFGDAGLSPKKVDKYINSKAFKDKSMWLYRDYIALAYEFDMNLKDDFVAYPRDLDVAHDNLIAIRDEEKNKKELKEAAEEDGAINAVYKKIRKKCSIETEDYVIRPAKTAREIVEEGQKLHHCVGGKHYRERMKEGRAFILFLRKKETPERPYYTIEMFPDGRINQAYAAYDKKPDFEKIEPVLEQLTEKVKNAK